MAFHIISGIPINCSEVDEGDNEEDEEAGDSGQDGQPHAATLDTVDSVPTDRRSIARRAKIALLWELLNGRPTASPTASMESGLGDGARPTLSEPGPATGTAPAPGSQDIAAAAAAGRSHKEGEAEAGSRPARGAGGPAGPSHTVALASLCRTVAAPERKRRAHSDAVSGAGRPARCRG
jgi:hypothetical protein